MLCDTVGDHPRPLADAFPGAPAAGWEAIRAQFPETVGVDGRWRFGTHVLLVRAGEACVLIDAGVGPAEAAAAQWLNVAGTLDDDLAGLGIAADDIDLVVLTHLHVDRVGWLPRFAGARHVLSAREWASVQGDAMPAHVRDTLAPIAAAGQLDPDGSLVDGLQLLPLPGHTPGHSGVLIEGEQRQVLFGGDAFNHPLQIDDPGVPSLADRDRAQAVATREDVLVRAESLTVLGAHLPGAFWPGHADGHLR